MLVPEKYRINFTHTKKDFVDKTYSGFKKSDVNREFTKAIKKGSLENTNSWSIEIVLSGYIEQYWKKVITMVSKDINIYNVSLPIYLWNMWSNYNKLLQSKIDIFEMRNYNEIRNSISSLSTILCLSNKKQLPKLPKMAKEQMGVIHDKSKMLSRDLNLIQKFIKINDCSEIILVINEIATIININNRSFSHQEKCMYWLSWLIYYQENKEKDRDICSERITKNVDQSLSKDISFFLWQIILDEAKNRENPKLFRCIQCLCQLFKCYITKANIKSKFIHIQHALLLLLNTLPGIEYNISIFPNKEICIKYPLKINFYYDKIIKNTKRTYYVHYKKEKKESEETSLFSKEVFTPIVNPDSYKKFQKKMPPPEKQQIIPEKKPLAKKNKLILSEINSLLTNEYDIVNKVSEEYDEYEKND